MKILLFILLLSFSFTQDYSLSFDGNGSSVVDVSDLVVSDTPTLTFSLDFKLDTVMGDSNNHDTIFDFENSDFRYALNVYDIWNAKLEFIMETHDIRISYDQYVADNNWHNVVIQLNPTNATLIFDNEQVDYQSWNDEITYKISGDSYEDFIGANQPPSYPYFIRGNIDNFIISNELLSVEQIQDIDNYNSEVNYKFNEGEGNSIYDSSGNENHANFYDYGVWEEQVILGDINEDGELNIQDILFIVGLVLELGYPADYYEIADMNQDGVLNIQDIILIIDIILDN
tara:strand:+ start:131 stop:988 length:858 start_codon:yes stop_codon:yes gene_type:complete